MSRQSLLLLLFVASFMLNAHAQIDPAVWKCIEVGSNVFQNFKKIRSDGQCRQPFEIGFAIDSGSAQHMIQAKMIADPIDESIVQYSFNSCKLKLKAFNQNGNSWVELLDAGPDSGTRLEQEFIVQLYGDRFRVGSNFQMTNTGKNYFIDCAGSGDPERLDFKQEIQIGEPNIVLIFNEDNGYFGRADVRSARLLGGGLPPYPSTTTTSGLSSTTTSSTDAETTKFDSSTVATTTKTDSSSTKAVSSTDSSSTKAVSSTSSFFKESTTIATTPSATAAEEKGMKPWLIGVIIGAWTFILIIAIIIGVVCVIRCCCKKKARAVDETKTHEPAIGGETEKTKDNSREHSKSVY